MIKETIINASFHFLQNKVNINTPLVSLILLLCTLDVQYVKMNYKAVWLVGFYKE